MFVLALHALINIYSSHLVALFNNVSVWWHVAGVTVIIAILIFGPGPPERVVRLHRDDQQLGLQPGHVLVLRAAARLPADEYTITGFDASAHISEETHGAEEAAPKGVWRSVFYSALIGWVLLLALTFAATDTTAITDGGAARSRSSTARCRPRRRARDPHLLHRPALLRHGLRDERVAHDLRVLARPRDPRLADLDEAQRPPDAGRRGAVRRRRGAVSRCRRSGTSRRASPSRSSPSSPSASSASTSPTPSRSSCAGGSATRSRPARGTTARSTSG